MAECSSKTIEDYLHILLQRSIEILRNKFRSEWKIINSEEWNDSSAKTLSNDLDKKGKKKIKPEQKSVIKNKNIDEWDISIFGTILAKINLFSLSSEECERIEQLISLCKEAKGEKTEEDVKICCQQIISVLTLFGDYDAELQELKKSFPAIEWYVEMENRVEAERLNHLGRIAYDKRENSKAIEYFTHAANLTGISNSDLALIYSNRSECYIDLQDFDLALEDIEKIIEFRPQWWKGYYLKAQIYYFKNDMTKCGEFYMTARILAEPECNCEEILEILNDFKNDVHIVVNECEASISDAETE